MSKIDTSNWKEFTLDEILQKVDVKKIPLKKSECSDVQTKEFSLPARTATTQNQGLSCYVPRDCATVLKNKISVSANGDYCAFWHEDEFTILQDSYALEGNGFELTTNIALFIISLMNTALSSKYNWNNKSSWEKIRHEKIKLPVTEVEEIDWDYMSERIAELERERIAELENYLLVTGLNDYTLTDADKEILAIKLTDGGINNSVSESGCWKVTRKFKIGDLFDVITPIKRFNANSISMTDNIGHPYVVRSSINNGIRCYINEDEQYLNPANTFSFGQDTATVFWQSEPYFTGDKIKVLVPKFKCNDKIAMYLQNGISKAFSHFSWGTQSFKLSVIANNSFYLPIQTDSNNNPIIDSEHKYHPEGYVPDWEFMEKYIRAIEKVVIKDVVDWKDTMINTIKKVM